MKKLFIILIYIFIFCFTYESYAVLRTWNGAGSGGTSTDFNRAANWSGGVIPGPNDSAVMILNSNTNVTINLSGNITIGSLTISMQYTLTNQSRTVYIDARDYLLTINNNFFTRNISTTSSRTQLLYILAGGATASTGKIKVLGTTIIDDGSSTYQVRLGQRAYSPANSSVLPWEFYGNVNFGTRGQFWYEYQPTAVIFDAEVSQTVTINSNPYFPSIFVGNNNSPNVIFSNVTGKNTIWLREYIYYTDVFINEGATMDLTEGVGIASYQTYFNGSNFGDYFRLAGTIILRDTSGGLYGSNFPFGFGANTNGRGGYIVYPNCTEIYEATNGHQSKYLIGYSNNLIINNASGVTLGGELTVNETLNLQSGEFINGTALNSPLSTVNSDKKEKLEIFITPVNRKILTEEIEPQSISNFQYRHINTNFPADGPRANYLTMSDSSVIIRSGGQLSSIVPTFAGIVDIFYNQNSSNILTGVEIPSSTSALRNLTVNNSNGTTLGSNVTVNGQLFLTSGILTTESNTISFAINASDPVESNTGYILGNAAMLSRNVGTNSLVFLGVYLHAGSDLGTVSLTRKTGTAYTYGGNYSINCNWDINPVINPPAFPRLVDYTWLSVFDGLVGFNSSNNAKIFRSTDNGVTWFGIGDSVDVSFLNPRKIMNISADHFSIWTVSGTEGPLPVNLASFNFAISGRDLKLNWVTESEENNEGFEVQKTGVRGQESEIWNKIGFITGKGTKNSPTSYSFKDKNLQTGKYKYRLKQIDYNGNYEYFELNNIIEIGVPVKFDLSQNYPNPFNPVTKINFDIPESGLVTMKVYDMLGKEVAAIINEMKDAGYYTISFDASKLSSGVYFYRLTANGLSSVKRMAVIK